MIAYNHDIKELYKDIRQLLIEQSELNQKFIRNATSKYGTQLSKSGTDVIFESITQDDVVLFFELETVESNNRQSQTLDDDTIYYSSEFEIKTTTYGSRSMDVVNKLIARLRTGPIGDKMYAKGIYIKSVENPTHLHEFINGSLWERTDFSITIAIYSIFQPVVDPTDFEKLGDITINEA